MQPLTWKDLLAVTAAMPVEALTPDVLLELVARLELDAALLAPYIQFREAGYARNVLFRSEKFEAICLCWQPGQATTVHDHGRSFGAVAVYEGSLMVETFRRLNPAEDPEVARLSEVGRYYLAPGSVTLDREGSIHRLSNRPEAQRRAVSLHFYAGPLDTMRIYDLAAGSSSSKATRGEPMAYIEPSADVMAAMI